jgi:hypothetical protein
VAGVQKQVFVHKIRAGQKLVFALLQSKKRGAEAPLFNH